MHTGGESGPGMTDLGSASWVQETLPVENSETARPRRGPSSSIYPVAATEAKGSEAPAVWCWMNQKVGAITANAWKLVADHGRTICLVSRRVRAIKFLARNRFSSENLDARNYPRSPLRS
jgi:hypothetical protein